MDHIVCGWTWRRIRAKELERPFSILLIGARGPPSQDQSCRRESGLDLTETLGGREQSAQTSSVDELTVARAFSSSLLATPQVESQAAPRAATRWTPRPIRRTHTVDSNQLEIFTKKRPQHATPSGQPGQVTPKCQGVLRPLSVASFPASMRSWTRSSSDPAGCYEYIWLPPGEGYPQLNTSTAARKDVVHKKRGVLLLLDTSRLRRRTSRRLEKRSPDPLGTGD